ncbi:hypothetical protein [Streptomonospora arabica]|uniref:Secreted protein/lipoprotein n=1 Tax=Streptomonospora arabica TaxID=412417 RepID=A0ABV9SJ68_9ACTN
MLTALVLAGCTPSGNAPATPSAPPSATQSSPSASADDQALDAYNSMWDVIAEQSHSSDPDVTALEPYATGQALEFAQSNLEERAADGVIARGQPSHSPEVTAVDVEDGTAEISDCVDTTAWLQEDAETGELIDEKKEEPLRRQAEAVVQKDGITWKVSELLLGQIGSC